MHFTLKRTQTNEQQKKKTFNRTWMVNRNGAIAADRVNWKKIPLFALDCIFLNWVDKYHIETKSKLYSFRIDFITPKHTRLSIFNKKKRTNRFRLKCCQCGRSCVSEHSNAPAEMRNDEIVSDSSQWWRALPLRKQLNSKSPTISMFAKRYTINGLNFFSNGKQKEIPKQPF